MLIRLPHLCSFVSILGSALTASNDSAFDHWLVDSIETNLTSSSLGIPTPPAEFHIACTVSGPKLRITSCLMVTVAALKTLALGEWDAKIIDGTEYKLDSYPEVSILVSTPKRKRNIEARFVSWAITVGMYRMIRSKKFELAAFELRWSDVLVGWVHIVNNPITLDLAGVNPINRNTVAKRTTPSLGAGSTIDHTKAMTINHTDVITGIQVNDADDERLATTFVPEGDETLGIYDVFVPIMGALCEIAPHPSTYRSNGLMEGLQGYAGAICILPVLPLRINPPYLEFRWIARTIARIPAYMLEQRRFGNIKLDMAVDGVPIAFGALDRLPGNCPTRS